MRGETRRCVFVLPGAVLTVLPFVTGGPSELPSEASELNSLRPSFGCVAPCTFWPLCRRATLARVWRPVGDVTCGCPGGAANL